MDWWYIIILLIYVKSFRDAHFRSFKLVLSIKFCSRCRSGWKVGETRDLFHKNFSHDLNFKTWLNFIGRAPPIPLIYKRYDHTKNVKTFPKIVVTYISYTHIGRHVVGDEKPSRFNLGGNPSAVWAIEEAAIMAKAQGAQLFVSSMSSLNH